MIIRGCIGTILLIIAAELLAPVVCCLLDALMAWLHRQLKTARKSVIRVSLAWHRWR